MWQGTVTPSRRRTPGSIPGSPTIPHKTRELGCKIRRWATMAGHIMRLAAYLCTSRHGIFYFRYPLPACAHPLGQRSSVKVSMDTRRPREARQLARLLAVAGQSVLARPNVHAMRYDQMREHVRDHFSNLLQQFRECRAVDGPLGGVDLGAPRLSRTFAESATDGWLEFTRYDDATALLRAFCEARGITEIPSGREADLLLAEVRKGTVNM